MKKGKYEENRIKMKEGKNVRWKEGQRECEIDRKKKCQKECQIARRKERIFDRKKERKNVKIERIERMLDRKLA